MNENKNKSSWMNIFDEIKQRGVKDILLISMDGISGLEAVHSSLRKVCKKGSFESQKYLFKMLYLRIDELESRCKRGHVRNWSMVLNQLMIDDKYQSILDQYL